MAADPVVRGRPARSAAHCQGVLAMKHAVWASNKMQINYHQSRYDQDQSRPPAAPAVPQLYGWASAGVLRHLAHVSRGFNGIWCHHPGSVSAGVCAKPGPPPTAGARRRAQQRARQAPCPRWQRRHGQRQRRCVPVVSCMGAALRHHAPNGMIASSSSSSSAPSARNSIFVS